MLACRAPFARSSALPRNGLPMPLPHPLRMRLHPACLSLTAAMLLASCGAAPLPPPAPATVPAGAATVPATAPASAAFQTLPGLSAAQAQALGLGGKRIPVRFRDRHGEGLLVVERADREEADPDTPGDTLAVAVLSATLLERTDAPGYRQRWQRQIRVPCPGLDLDAGWLLDQVGATDLDGDGQAEITLASHTFCGGGVDPQAIHITLIDGARSYGIEGESLVSVPGEEPFGGERQDDPALAAAPIAFRQHLDAVWDAVRVLPVPDGDNDGNGDAP